MTGVPAALAAAADRLARAGERPAPPCQDPVDRALIRNWTQALGDTDPAWHEGGLAPPAMIQVWSMPGLGARGGSAADEVLGLLDASGYTGVVATNCEQTYDRYLRHGERLRSTMRFGGLAGPKKTAMGEGYFVTWHQTWYDERDERVAEMLFRVLKFRPAARGRPQGDRARPAIGPDTRFFWDGVEAGELRVQRCGDCGLLRHPPGPMCPRCHSVRREHVVACGRGEVHSFVVHHHPPVPGHVPPYVVALVELAEGVRVVGNVLDCPPGEVKIGMPLTLTFRDGLPQWVPAGAPLSEPTPEPATLEIELTPTFVIASALATRDLTPVHHDTALARAQGAKDIFLNILTTMGLVQRAALRAAPGAVIEGIATRLGVPAHAGDTLRLHAERTGAATVTVRGAVALGDHVTATVRIREDA
ncbi:OB-fold domain-containing protein [Spirillospora sp. CA-294931]|uniref:OB-fold domain-containing protein n=1 Tax=Spirillospora sp. CA-294931 TaxID=3240042 RepID=UPI003D8EEC6D